jgi:hypothetical protein
VVTILNQIYEEDFLGFSYGFRPGRSQHQALDALSYALVKKKVNYLLDTDIQGFVDNLDKAWMIKFIEHRVPDRRIVDSQVVLHNSIYAPTNLQKKEPFLRRASREVLPPFLHRLANRVIGVRCGRGKGALERYRVPPHEQYLCPLRSTCQ